MCAGVSSSDYHPIGTAALRRLVDAKLKVMGVGTLRVVDASVSLLLISRHIRAAIYAFAEKANSVLVQLVKQEALFSLLYLHLKSLCLALYICPLDVISFFYSSMILLIPPYRTEKAFHTFLKISEKFWTTGPIVAPRMRLISDNLGISNILYLVIKRSSITTVQ